MPLQADAGREAFRRRAPLRVPGAAERRRSANSVAAAPRWTGGLVRTTEDL